MNDAYYLHMAHGIELRLQQQYNNTTKTYENLFNTELVYKLKPMDGTSKFFKGTIEEVTKYIVENLDIFKPF